jgi:hypothetical protein
MYFNFVLKYNVLQFCVLCKISNAGRVCAGIQFPLYNLPHRDWCSEGRKVGVRFITRDFETLNASNRHEKQSIL